MTARPIMLSDWLKKKSHFHMCDGIDTW